MDTHASSDEEDSGASSLSDDDEEEVDEEEDISSSQEIPAANGGSSSSSAGGRQGQIEVKDSRVAISLGKTRWRSRWVMLVKGSVHLFKNYDKTTPYCSINLREVDIVEFPSEKDREHGFGLIISGEHKWFSGSQQEVSVWREAFLHGKTQEPSPAPARTAIPKSHRTNSPLFRAKKSVAGRAATTKVGKSMMKKMFGQEVANLMETLKKVITKHAGKETANKVEKRLVRSIVKIGFQFEKKNLSAESLICVDRPFREAVELISKFYNSRMRRYTRINNEDQCFKRVEALVHQGRDELCTRLQPYFSPKNLEYLRFVFDTLSNPKFLESVFTDPEISDELDEIDDAITSYTQFHF